MTKPNLKLVLFKHGWTGRELARRTAIQESIISLICNGRYNPDPVQRATIASALNMPEEMIFRPIDQAASLQ